MSRRRRQSLSPTLFPFLAVLVCTLGTLILLLALVAQNASDAAQQIAEEVAQAEQSTGDQLTVGDVQDLVEEEEFRLGELISFREAQTGDLENRRDQLAHVDDHMRRIRERLKQIGAAMKQAKSDEPASAATIDEVEKLKQELADEKLVVKKLRDEVQTAKPRFVIVPHQGPNGTTRRPIYLECNAEGVTIWPEGVVITAWQLEQANREANPLDDALRAARYHAMQEYGDSVPPYPMLLVRPDGIDNYFAARASMLDWDDQFGYEMVPSEVSLAYPAADSRMRQRIQYAVDQAVERVNRIAVARSVSGRGGYGGEPGGSAGRGGYGKRYSSGAQGTGRVSAQGSGRGGTPPVNRKMPTLSVNQMDSQGRRSGFRDHRTGQSGLYRGNVGTAPNSGGALSPEAAKARLEQQLADASSTLPPGGSGNSFGESGMTALDELTRSGRGAASNRGTPTPSGAGSNSGMQLPSTGESSGVTSSSAGSRSAVESLRGTAAGNDSPIPLTDPSGLQNGVDPTSRSANNQQTGSGLMLPSDNAVAGGTGDSQVRLGGASNDEGRENPNQEANSETRSSIGAFGPNAGSASRMPQSASGQQAKQTSTSADPSNPQSPSASPRPSSPQSGSPMVSRDGANWALPRSVAVGRGNEIIRSVRLEVHENQFVLLPGAGMRTVETFPLDAQGLNVATLRMATAVRDRIKGWGPAAPGARWSPLLKVDVMPDADYRYEQLLQLMGGSGLEIERSQYSRAKIQQDGGLR